MQETCHSTLEPSASDTLLAQKLNDRAAIQAYFPGGSWTIAFTPEHVKELEKVVAILREIQRQQKVQLKNKLIEELQQTTAELEQPFEVYPEENPENGKVPNAGSIASNF